MSKNIQDAISIQTDIEVGEKVYKFKSITLNGLAEFQEWCDINRIKKAIKISELCGKEPDQDYLMTLKGDQDFYDEEIQKITDEETKAYADAWWASLWKNIQGGILWFEKKVEGLGIFKWLNNIDWKATWGAIIDGILWFEELVEGLNIWDTEWWIGLWKKIEDWGIWKWFKNIENWTVWTWFAKIGDWVIWDTEWWIGQWKKVEDWGIWAWFKNIKNWEIWDWFENKLVAFDVWEAEFMQSFVDTIATIWGSLLGRIAPPINGVLAFIEESVNSMISGLNKVIELINKVPVIGNLISKIPTIAIPEISIPSHTTAPAQSGSASWRPKKFAYGGIVTRPTMAEVGEGGDTEGVFPLNKTSMKPFADMIGGLINGSGGAQNVADDYVLIPVNKRQLERELYVIRKQEIARKGI